MYKQIRTGKFVTTGDKKRTKKTNYGWIIRGFVCAFLFLIVFMIAYLNTPVTNKVKSGLMAALTFEIDVDKTLGKLKFVQSNEVGINDSVTSSANITAFDVPMKNYVVSKDFSQDDPYMTLEATDLTDVVAPCDGTVEYVQKEQQFEITIDHGNGLKSVVKFNGAMAVINEGDKLKKGDYIGLVEKNGLLKFGLIENGKNVNPFDYIK